MGSQFSYSRNYFCEKCFKFSQIKDEVASLSNVLNQEIIVEIVAGWKIGKR
jgi:hypothetical protein